MVKLILLGASGNIGEQALSLIKNNKDYQLVAFSVGDNTSKIASIIKEHPEVKTICAKKMDDALIKKYPKIRFYFSDDGLSLLVKETDADLLLNALVGFVGLPPTLEAIDKDMDIALANKESLVVGGELIKKALKHSKSTIYPVDSEHSAIYKCLKACKSKEVKEIILTASGGAFRNLKYNELNNVTAKDALKHPTWKMGDRVTIDSSNLVNKAFEVIEAHYLFDVDIDDIKILMHDESYVHSIVHLKDDTYLGEVNKPDMKNPISYALARDNSPKDVKHVNKIEDFGNFHFREFNAKRYPLVDLILEAYKKKGTMMCVINAVDEVAVSLFLNDMISYLDIENVLKLALKTFKNHKHPSLTTLIQVDKEAREWAKTAALLKGSL